jgi:hypothetical protein
MPARALEEQPQGLRHCGPARCEHEHERIKTTCCCKHGLRASADHVLLQAKDRSSPCPANLDLGCGLAALSPLPHKEIRKGRKELGDGIMDHRGGVLVAAVG